MSTRAGLFATATLLAATVNAPISGQPAEQRVIVVFHDDVSLQPFAPGRLEARARANPAAWAYLDRAVVGAVQALEAQHGFRADYVYSEAVRGFAAALTDVQIRALQRDPVVAYVEPDTEMHLLEQTLPWGIDRIDTDISSTAAGDGAGAVTNVHVYILDNGADRTHPDLNVVDQVNFTDTANMATCAHGTRVAGVLAASGNAIDVVGALPGAPITAVKVTTCDPVFFSASSVIKGVDWVLVALSRIVSGSRIMLEHGRALARKTLLRVAVSDRSWRLDSNNRHHLHHLAAILVGPLLGPL